MATALFVCLHNAGRSQMSQALFERAATGRHHALSAGTTAGDRVHPEVVEVMRELDINLANRTPQLLTRELAQQADVVITMGCGVPTAVADLHEGETVLDLGSGAGADVLISARRVGPTGNAIGLDMTDEMLELARANAAKAGVENVEFVKGYIEDIPLADGTVDVIVSNCVLNLSGDKPKVLREAARVLKPGGRFAVSDVIASPAMDDATRADMAEWTGCIAGALTEEEFRDGLTAAGFTDIQIRETHQVHEFASSAIIRARKPGRSADPTVESIDVTVIA